MTRRDNRRSAFAVYLTALAISDTGSLFTWAFRWYLISFVDRAILDHECKVDVGLKYMFRQAGYIIIISLTADRYVVVKYPLRAVAWSTPRRAVGVCSAAAVSSLAYAAPYFMAGRGYRRYACMIDSDVMSVVYIWSVMLFGLAIPFVVISWMNFVIAVSIRGRLQYRGARCTEHSLQSDMSTSSLGGGGTQYSAASKDTVSDTQVIILNKCIRVLESISWYTLVYIYPVCEYRLQDNLWYSPLNRNCIHCIMWDYFYSINHIQFN